MAIYSGFYQFKMVIFHSDLPFSMGFNRNIMVGWWFGAFFFHKLERIIPTDELMFFRGVETTNQNRILWDL